MVTLRGRGHYHSPTVSSESANYCILCLGRCEHCSEGHVLEASSVMMSLGVFSLIPSYETPVSPHEYYKKASLAFSHCLAACLTADPFETW